MLGLRKRLDFARFVGLSKDEIRALVADATSVLVVRREPMPEG